MLSIEMNKQKPFSPGGSSSVRCNEKLKTKHAISEPTYEDYTTH